MDMFTRIALSLIALFTGGCSLVFGLGYLFDPASRPYLGAESLLSVGLGLTIAGVCVLGLVRGRKGRGDPGEGG